jgi:7,8-dihydropterin-6-yl-methyl-4-(beta-D-ribofuranosyl)aminobenzene 5'-phosphate synthase
MPNPFRITLLVDHQAISPDLATEHGLSFLLELGERVILFDTGASDAFLRNADRLGLPLDSVGHVILSHGHWDHSGGLGAALDRVPEAKVYLHPRALGPKYSRHPDRPVRAIGFPKESWSAVCPVMHQVNWTTAPMCLAADIGLTGPIPKWHSLERNSGPFFLDPEGQQPDPFEDEQALWIRTPTGLVVIMGCAHAGVVNTLEYVRGITGETCIRAVLGGLHLVKASEERLRFTVEALQRLEVAALFPCHCSGESEVALLRAHLGDRVRTLAAGGQYLLDPFALSSNLEPV